METVSSFELKDLFRKCPRLKTKLSGQELRAISETIDDRVRIQHNDLLAKIARLEMHRSHRAFNTKQLSLSKTDEGEQTSDKRRPESRHDHSKMSEHSCVAFTLPRTGNKNSSSIRTKSGESPRTEVSNLFPPSDTFTQTKKELRSIQMSNGDNRSNGATEICPSSAKQYYSDEIIGTTRQYDTACGLSGSLPFIKDDTSLGWVEEVKKKDILIQNLTKEIDFIKTILNERSGYDRILQESLRQNDLIDQLKMELSTKRKDIIDLMKDIQRMRYAFSINSCQSPRCFGIDKETSVYYNSSKPKPERRPRNEGSSIKKAALQNLSGGKSVLVSSQYYKLDVTNNSHSSSCP